VSFIRRGATTEDLFLVACNFTPTPRHNYRVGVPRGGPWREVLNSDAREYWGQGYGNLGGVEAAPFPTHGREHSVVLTLPPLGVVFFKSEMPKGGEAQRAEEAAAKPAPAAPAESHAHGHAEKPVKRRAPSRNPRGRRGA